jgi:hypothetical protein
MKNKRFYKLLIMLLVFVNLFALSSCKSDDDNDGGNGGNNNQQQQPTDFTDLSVRDYVGSNGIVAAANPYAAKAGLDILEAGGNAFDAAVAVSFALGVVEPNASGLGGGGILVAYEADSGDYVSYNFREFVPGLGKASAYNGDADIDGGIKSSGVPGVKLNNFHAYYYNIVLNARLDEKGNPKSLSIRYTLYAKLGAKALGKEVTGDGTVETEIFYTNFNY